MNISFKPFPPINISYNLDPAWLKDQEAIDKLQKIHDKMYQDLLKIYENGMVAVSYNMKRYLEKQLVTITESINS